MILFIIASIILGVAVGIVLKDKVRVLLLSILLIVFLLFLPKTIMGYTISAGMSLLFKSPLVLFIKMMVSIFIIFYIGTVSVVTIIESLKSFDQLFAKIALGINVIVLISFAAWSFDYILLMFGEFVIPTVYNVLFYGAMQLVSLILILKINPTTTSSGFAINFGNKKEAITDELLEKYRNNEQLLIEHQELGIISTDEYRAITIELFLENN